MQKSCASVAVVLAAFARIASADPLVFDDPEGDDKGPGTYVYPTGSDYTKGSFDLTRFSIEDKGDEVELRIAVAARIEDPWNSKSWPGTGNGFSLQMAFVFLDEDHKAGPGETRSPPGLNVRFAPDQAWDKCVIISPQPRSRLMAEINAKARDMKDRLVIPKRTVAHGKELVAVVSRKDLEMAGALPMAAWGYQVVMESNEGYPDKGDLMTRRVNEYAGEHRFGGGNDGDCDPHVLDILMPPAKGAAGEVQAQYEVLKQFVCSDDPTKVKLAVVPLVYRP